ncbi:MAG: hypothetical protein Q9164_001084 [Protoblastenia rupestris]
MEIERTIVEGIELSGDHAVEEDDASEEGGNRREEDVGEGKTDKEGDADKEDESGIDQSRNARAENSKGAKEVRKHPMRTPDRGGKRARLYRALARDSFVASTEIVAKIRHQRFGSLSEAEQGAIDSREQEPDVEILAHSQRDEESVRQGQTEESNPKAPTRETKRKGKADQLPVESSTSTSSQAQHQSVYILVFYRNAGLEDEASTDTTQIISQSHSVIKVFASLEKAKDVGTMRLTEHYSPVWEEDKGVWRCTAAVGRSVLRVWLVIEESEYVADDGDDEIDDYEESQELGNG